MNARNNGIVMGRLTRNVSVLTNRDGSRKGFVTVAVPCSYKGKDGKRPSDFISLEGFVPASKSTNGVYDYMHKGDLVSIGYTIKSQAYTTKEGKQEYRQYLSVENVELISTKRNESENTQHHVAINQMNNIEKQNDSPAMEEVTQENINNIDPLANMREAVDVDYSEVLNDINDFTELPW